MGVGLVGDKLQIKWLAAIMVNGQQNAIATALIGAVHVHEASSRELWLHPFTLHLPQDPLDCRRAHTVSLGNLRYGLLVGLVQSPHFSFFRPLSRGTELMTASHTFV